MAKFSRGAQLGNKQVAENRERRRQQIAGRNKELRQEKAKSVAKKGIAVLVVVLMGVYLFNRQFVRYDQSEIGSQYAATVEQYFNEKPLSKSKLFFNHEDLHNYIINIHPEVSSVSVSTKLFGNDKFEFMVKQPAFVWQAESAKFYGDADGIIYESGEADTSGNLLVIKDGAALQSKAGDKVMSSSTLDYIKQIQSELNSRSIKVAYYQIPAVSREVHVYLDGKPYFIKMSLERSVVGQSDEIAKAVKYLDSSNKSVKQYVDVRTEDRAYYR